MIETLHRLMRAAFGKPGPMLSPDERVRVLQVRPGDTLVVTTDRNLHNEQRARLAEHVKARVPEGVNVMVLDGGLQLQVVRTQGKAEDHASQLAELRKIDASLQAIEQRIAMQIQMAKV